MTSIRIEDFPTRERLTWWQERGLQFTATGYGSKIPTTREIKYGSRWHRIYCAIWSNVGSCFIVSRGMRIYVD